MSSKIEPSKRNLITIGEYGYIEFQKKKKTVTIKMTGRNHEDYGLKRA